MQRRSWPLGWLIGGAYFLIIALTLGPLALYLAHQTEKDYLAARVEALRGQVELGAHILRDIDITAYMKLLPTVPAKPSDDPLLTTVRAIKMRSGARMVILVIPGDMGKVQIASQYPYGYVRGDTMPLTPEMNTVLQGAQYGTDIRPNTLSGGEQTLYVAVPVKKAHEVTPHAILVMGDDLSSYEAAVARMRGGFAWGLLALLAILLVVIISVTAAITRPLARMSAVAERIADGALESRVEPTGAAEVVSMGVSFNRMTGRLRDTIIRLAAERAQAEAILAGMVDGVLVVNPDGVILLINGTAEALLNARAADVVGRTVDETLLHEELIPLLARAQEKGGPLTDEITLTHPTHRVVEVHMAPVEADGARLGTVIVLYDVTQQRHMEQMHRDFVANVSHELRTPVASIRAMAETVLIMQGEDPRQAEEFLNTIVSESDRFTELIDDLLNLARLEAGYRLLTPAPVDVSEVIRHAATRVMSPITEKGQTLTLDLPSRLGATLDRDALVQVLVNLVDNARKYSPEKAAITVRAAVDRGPVGQTLLSDQFVRIQVSDTGIGIPEDELDRIFERFYRVDHGRARSGGTGLGLFIVRQLVEMQGGRILVESEVGVGTTFTVILPQAPPGGEGDTPMKSGPPTGKGDTPVEPPA